MVNAVAVTVISPVGPPGGTFVLPKAVADQLIADLNGDVSALEQALGLDPGTLGPNPVRIDIQNPEGLRVPSGNEPGANEQWVPGGTTSGGLPEAVIDPVPPGQWTVRPNLSNSRLAFYDGSANR